MQKLSILSSSPSLSNSVPEFCFSLHYFPFSFKSIWLNSRTYNHNRSISRSSSINLKLKIFIISLENQFKLQFYHVNQNTVRKSQNYNKQMQAENRKRKKVENHQVKLLPDKAEASFFEVHSVQNAYFPYEPYPEQVILIKKIHESIKNQQNALIQSPTGTGKTLCMLVASLSCLCSLTLCHQKVPKIYYLTRTHSQITQVVNELKRINCYQLRINIIASRQHLCINRNLRQLKGRMLDRGCQQMCRQKLCKFKQETSDNSMPVKEWLTLEEVCQKGNQKGFCPYYYNKSSTQKCELTIMPFNYLLDWSLLENNNLNLKNSVIIFDEAHNVDSLAEEGSSLEIDSEMLNQCLAQIKNLEQSSKCRYLHKKFQAENDSSDYSYVAEAKSLVARMVSCLKESDKQRNCNNLEDMLGIMKRMTNFVCNGRQFKGADLNTYEDVLFCLDKVKKLFTQKKIEGGQFDIFYSTFTKIMKILDSSSSNLEEYYMHLGPKSLKGFSLKLNCLNASFTFQRIAEQKPRSIILCSGTLGPFEIWEKQLGISFPTKIRVPSFISPNQIRAQIVQNSLDRKVRFDFSYQNRNREEQFQAFAQQLKSIEKIVPHGIVVAFSTYQLMQKCINHCIGLKKPVFYQSKNENVQKVYLKYSESAKSVTGAFLFIVIKGKFSEGINFHDQLCRCLIVVGIPFLPPNDFKVMKKKSYLQNKLGKEAADQWYYLQTFKSVNQVIGRAIRSKQDYACILLFDQRYSRKDILKQLSSWFVNNLPKKFESKYTDTIRHFFQSEPWSHAMQEKLNPESSFQNALSKTLLAEDTTMEGLQMLLEQETPVKVNKGRSKKLKIESDDEITQEKQRSHTKLINFSNKSDQEDTKKFKKTETYPWLSVDYFIGEQIKDYVIKSKAKIQRDQKSPQLEDGEEQKAMLTFDTNKKRKKTYI